MEGLCGVFICALGIGWGSAAGVRAGDSAADSTGTRIAGLQAPQAGSQGARRLGSGSELVYKDRLAPHWFQNNTRFWYRNELRGGAREFIAVDAERGVRAPAFDHARLAASLSRAAGLECRAERLPFERIEFVPDSQVIRFAVGDATWECNLATYECAKTDARLSEPPEGERNEGGDARRPRRSGRGRRSNEESDRSPDGQWTAYVKDHNVFVKPAAGEEIQLSQDGAEGLAYGRLIWAPDSKTLVAYRIEPGERKEVYLVESSPRGGGRARFEARPYELPGDKFTTYELNLFDLADRRQVKPEVDRIDLGWPELRWKGDGRHFAYVKVDRGHQRLRVIEVDSHSGKVRNLIDEQTPTFIWTAHTENLNLTQVNWLERTDEIIYASESNGWRHLYLVDATAGKLKNAITHGQWVVRGIDRIDEEQRQVWFQAGGFHPGQDPYFVHHCRVNFDGTGLVALTEGNGHHSVQYSPDRKYLVDRYSRVDLPPVHELRRVSDGKLVCLLEEADVADLKESGWEAPEVFVAKGRDGTTDIWGIICRPRGFDPNKKYPVIEDIYAGPQGSFVPKTFSASRRFASLTDLGFIVVKMDGMGTANRSKAFHDVCWHNLKDAGFPDRILWHKAVAARYPSYDLSRVGIYGNSAGGQSAAGAVLFHPDFYHAAVASCGCHDNRMDKASWNEQWMGYPVGPHYAECSNIEHAHRLRGKLFLIVGELDNNVPPESTMRLVDALVKAGKDFDLLVIPGGGHGMGGAYGQRRMQDFFVRHLLATEPPDRNAEPGPQSGALQKRNFGIEHRTSNIERPTSKWIGASFSYKQHALAVVGAAD